MSTLAHHWLHAGARAWTMFVATLLASMLVGTLLFAGGFAGALAWLPPTWFGTEWSPDYVLNGRFEGVWILLPGQVALESGWERLELRITEDVALLQGAHPAHDAGTHGIRFPTGTVARGELLTEEEPLGFELTFGPHSPALELAEAPEDLEFLSIGLEARDPGRTDTLSLRTPDGRRSQYRRSGWVSF